MGSACVEVQDRRAHLVQIQAGASGTIILRQYRTEKAPGIALEYFYITIYKSSICLSVSHFQRNQNGR